jgi:hypothetical protein
MLMLALIQQSRHSFYLPPQLRKRKEKGKLRWQQKTLPASIKEKVTPWPEVP